MPLPRNPHPKRRASVSRSSRRRRHTQAWLTAKLEEKFGQIAALIEANRQREAKEKAPGLSTGGSSSSED